MGDLPDSIEGLKLEVERLQRDLALANHEKIQSAQYGLDLLKEKGIWQGKCEEYENLYDNTRHELECMKEALAKFQCTHNLSTKSGIEQEESLLSEKASREASLTSNIFELENELRQSRHHLDGSRVEKEQLNQEINDLQKTKELFEWEKKNMKTELKELKFRETRLLSDYSELEEENITLQKQVSSLKSSQVEFEGAKHELRRLQEEVTLLNNQVEELTNLKKIAEKHLGEALEALQTEREQKYSLRKELDQQRISSEMRNLSKLAFNRLKLAGLNEDNIAIDDIEGEDDSPTLKRLEADFIKSPTSESMLPNQSGDLFSELHLTELKKLEKQLEQTENEKSMLSKHLKESQDMADKYQNEIKNKQLQVMQLMSHLDALVKFHQEMPTVTDNATGTAIQDQAEELMRLKQLLEKHERRFVLASKHVGELQKDLKELQERSLSTDKDSDDMAVHLRDEIWRLKNKILDYEQTNADLEGDVHIMSQITGLSQSSLGATQDELVNISESLALLYHHVCMVNGETPNLVMLDHMRASKELHKRSSLEKATTSEESLDSTENGGPSSANYCEPNQFEQLREKLKSDVRKKLAEKDSRMETRGDPTTCAKLVETVQDQINFLRRAIETTLELSRQKGSSTMTSDVDNGSLSLTGSEVEELQEQVIKLKSLLSTKREQIATLRTVLKANKQTAEHALANLKSKYENEKAIVSETMLKLRNELKALKEDAATFASLRAMFAARCEEYVTQLDEQRRNLTAAEDEKKTLNSLLRMAIQQKLHLTQRLEDVEMDRERSNIRRSNSSSTYPGGSVSPHGGGSGSGQSGRSKNAFPRVSHHSVTSTSSSYSASSNSYHGHSHDKSGRHPRRDY